MSMPSPKTRDLPHSRVLECLDDLTIFSLGFEWSSWELSSLPGLSSGSESLTSSISSSLLTMPSKNLEGWGFSLSSPNYTHACEHSGRLCQILGPPWSLWSSTVMKNGSSWNPAQRPSPPWIALVAWSWLFQARRSIGDGIERKGVEEPSIGFIKPSVTVTLGWEISNPEKEVSMSARM